MQRGVFTSTFYVPEGPTISLTPLDLQLTAVEQQLVNDIMATDTLDRIKLEMRAAGQGLVWNKDHFELIPHQGSQQHQALITHRM